MKQPPWRGRGPLVPASLVLIVAFHPFCASAETAAAAEPVILVQPTAASFAVRRSLARIRDELSAGKLHVVVADDDPNAVVITAVKEPAGGTILALFGDPETGQAEICVVARAGRRTAVRRATVIAEDPERMPEKISARALELLRATALELSIGSEEASPMEKPPEPPTAPMVPTRSVPRAPATETSSFAIDMGIGMFGSLDGPPPALLPMIRIRLHLSTWIHARVSAAGFGSRPSVEAPSGSATLSQNFALVELLGEFRSERLVRPVASLGVGVFHVSVDGTGVPPYEGREPQQWSAAFDGGLGVAFGILARAAVVTEFHALLASPHPDVRFVDTPAATIGYPSFVLTLALQVSP